MSSAWRAPIPFGWKSLIEIGLTEDIGTGDVTASTFPPDLLVDWYIESQREGIVCGVGLAEEVFAKLGHPATTVHKQDGSKVENRTLVLSGRGPAEIVLMGERLALNFLMQLSGVATLTNQFVREIKGTNAKIIDTRKTTPGLRNLQKYAVRCGEGSNHRMGLYDGVMLKDNHIVAYGGIKNAVAHVKTVISHMVKIEIECESLQDVTEAIGAGIDVVMLDNMSIEAMQEVVHKYKGQALFEASGGIDLGTVRAVAETGVNFISVGALTHSAIALPFHLELGDHSKS